MPQSLHPFLVRDGTGEITIRWPRVVALLAAYVIGALIVSLFVRHYGRSFRASQLVVPIVFCLLPNLLILHLAKRHAEGRSFWQFSLATLLVSLTVACILLAVLGSAHRADLEHQAKRLRLENAIMQIVGNGIVRLSSTTIIQVRRPTFNDEDLRKLLQLRNPLEGINAPISVLDVSYSQVTDQGVAELKQLDSLETCALVETAITDASIDTLTELPNLKLLSVTTTSVTPERLLKLSSDRPNLIIAPTDYRRIDSK